MSEVNIEAQIQAAKETAAIHSAIDIAEAIALLAKGDERGFWAKYATSVLNADSADPFLDEGQRDAMRSLAHAMAAKH